MKGSIAIHTLVLGTLLASSPAVARAGSFKAEPGLQLYSLRDDFKKDVPGTLKKVQAFGTRLVELAGTYDLPAAKFKELLAAHGLSPVSAHFPYDRFKEDPESVAREAKALGVRYAGCAWITHTGVFDEKQCRDASEVFNRAGATLARHGLKFFYHTHGFEFQPHRQGTLFDLLMAETNPETVSYEMDVFWVVHPGHDPAKLLARYGKRWELMHLKDMKKGVQTGNLSGKSDVTNDVTLGTGQMNWSAILQAAEKAGVKYYFIEDESPTSAQQIPESLKFLKRVKW